ncbi:prepilin-type N-terminal cleavage/methylation domain-containing protein [Sporosarcina beigongshangi]|uniref:prepilin-type N-terminal cleavage/methylation domain-containing protein n=1 Tax=Sporosarcina beigongshangi TaxID=2782538 RepID=UPI0019398CA0|nr:prepilin-type N-terminal cleavage/methylation domain-containing protein [Sporosarcina beigongshangi]
MSKWIKNERGLTLIELLAATILTALIAVFAFSLLMKGIQHYNNIAMDTVFRDEADILMSSLVKELYTTKESQITKKHFPEENTKNYYFEINKTNPKSNTGFINKKLYIQGDEILVTNSAITITGNSKIEANDKAEDGVYTITLELHMPMKNQTVEFINEIRTINDISDNKEEE